MDQRRRRIVSFGQQVVTFPREASRGTRTEIALVIDDDVTIRSTLSRFLTGLGYQVLLEDSGEDGIVTYRRERPHVVILDLGLPDRAGLDVLDDLRSAGGAVIVLTGRADVPTAVTAMQHGAEDFLTKPVELSHLAAAVARTVETARVRREVRMLRSHSRVTARHGVLGSSPAMRALEDEIAALAAGSRTTMLIEGESGTGKGRVAEWVHALSPRADRPFVTVNCGGLSGSFLDSELFGHERGAFTDAKVRKEGLLEVANTGSLFLDEIGALMVDLQPKLLTALDTGRFRRLGGTRELSTDVRLIAATNRDLKGAVEEGAFREDLYYRLAVSVVHLPPVRERTHKDRLHLIKQVLHELTAEIPDGPVCFRAKTLERLLAYSWPGNVREMRNVLERGMILARGEAAIGIEHLPRDLRQRSRREESDREPLTLQDAERRQIRRILEFHGGNRTRTAKDLGISRVTLLKKIRKYCLE